MRPSTVRLIAVKEVRDLLRDRRTVLLIVILPALLYPIFGVAAFAIAKTLLDQTTTVGVVGREHLPTTPRLYADGRFVVKPKSERDGDAEPKSAEPTVVETDGDPKEALRQKQLDVAIVIPANFAADVARIADPAPTVTVLSRDGDEKSKIAARRVVTLLKAWEDEIVTARIAERGLPKHFDSAFALDDPVGRKPVGKKAADELRDQFVKVFPFILMLWLAAGAVQPAVDITAGERERGTLETLLISPASRVEIVLGKWLATTLFGFASVVWNVIWLAAGAIVLQVVLGNPIVSLPGMAGCVLLGLPLAMLFAAVALTLGVFAKSTKEGQFYQLPLMLGTMVLAFGSMVPGQELTAARAAVPVLGAMLFQQKLLSPTGDAIPWHAVPILVGSLALVIGIALVIAARQFNREGVLFRESGKAA
jgi:sodium transport system permease protein